MTDTLPSPRTRLRLPLRYAAVVAAAAIIAFATNLRITIGSLGVLLDPIQADLGMTPTVAGVLTTLPLIAFATVGFASSGLVRRLGLHRTALLVLLVMAASVAARAVAGTAALFLLFSAMALGAVAVGNVILPALVKANFPRRIALMSSLYGAAVMAGISIASVLTVPISDALGSWRAGLGVWAAVALVAVLPWLFFRTPGRDPDVEVRAIPWGRVLRSRTMWALTACFGLQSAHAYAYFGWYAVILTDAGLDPQRAGLMLGLITGVGIPLTLALPLLLRWFGGGVVLPVVFGVATAAGWSGVLLAPTSATWLWSVLLGVGGVSFTWTLTMIGTKAGSAEGTAALSAATQGIGYLIAGLGPFGVGIAHDLAGTWDAPLVVLIAGSSLVAVSAVAVVRSPPFADDAVVGATIDG